MDGERKASKGGGPFHRRLTDKRLVKQVATGKRTPTRWTDMDPGIVDCKLMEVRKFSANYYEIETKFRRPALELISAYTVQNPFLWGQYLLRREQMKQQTGVGGHKVKEKDFFYATDRETFEQIARYNFDQRFGDCLLYTSPRPRDS